MPRSPDIEVLGPVRFAGHPTDGRNLSGLGLVGDLLVTAGDEDDHLQVLRREGDHYRLLPEATIPLNHLGQEADIEGIAREGNIVHVIGSHSRARSKPKATASRLENRTRMETIQPVSPFRCILARFQLEADGSHSPLETTTLLPALEASKILGPFTRLPCKENGVDIEGLASRDGLLHVGFRGPVLQRGFVPVLTCSFANPIVTGDLLFLQLGGRGIRDLERVEGGFLVLAGPVSDAPTSFQIHFWDGTDTVPGADVPASKTPLVLLGELDIPDGVKAEGVALETESAGHYTVLVLFDGLDDGATRLRIRKVPRKSARRRD